MQGSNLSWRCLGFAEQSTSMHTGVSGASEVPAQLTISANNGVITAGTVQEDTL